MPELIATPQSTDAPAGAKSILLVEDNPAHRFLMQSELYKDYRLRVAADVETALAFLHDQPGPAYDLFIIDTLLPLRAGEPDLPEGSLQILEAIEECCKTTPVIVVTSGSPLVRTGSQTAHLKIARTFEKPFSIREFHNYVDTLLSGMPMQSA